MLSPCLILRLLRGTVVPAELNEEVSGAETAVRKMLWTLMVVVAGGVIAFDELHRLLTALQYDRRCLRPLIRWPLYSSGRNTP